MSGAGGYFSIAGANPLLLEPLVEDPALRRTQFVMLHGGWPFVREAGALLQKPNAWLDLSQQSLSFPPRALAGWLREWLETFPDKVLFATDGYSYPFSESLCWEEATLIASRNLRRALGIAPDRHAPRSRDHARPGRGDRARCAPRQLRQARWHSVVRAPNTAPG
jgi:predicted TIM-barrel fold metal-dependent hydrolase